MDPEEVDLDKERRRGSYDVNIDFDEASRQWLSNKCRNGASYSYICGAIKTNGKICRKKPSKMQKALRNNRRAGHFETSIVKVPCEWGYCTHHEKKYRND